MKTSEKRENNLSHLAIIMDGNGRWSEQKGLPREDGHKEGVESLRKLLRYIDDFKIPYLTVFSFSTDNWNRPKSEISNLMNLLRIKKRLGIKIIKRGGIGMLLLLITQIQR